MLMKVSGYLWTKQIKEIMKDIRHAIYTRHFRIYFLPLFKCAHIFVHARIDSHRCLNRERQGVHVFKALLNIVCNPLSMILRHPDNVGWHALKIKARGSCSCWSRVLYVTWTAWSLCVCLRARTRVHLIYHWLPNATVLITWWYAWKIQSVLED